MYKVFSVLKIMVIYKTCFTLIICDDNWTILYHIVLYKPGFLKLEVNLQLPDPKMWGASVNASAPFFQQHFALSPLDSWPNNNWYNLSLLDSWPNNNWYNNLLLDSWPNNNWYHFFYY